MPGNTDISKAGARKRRETHYQTQHPKPRKPPEALQGSRRPREAPGGPRRPPSPRRLRIFLWRSPKKTRNPLAPQAPRSPPSLPEAREAPGGPRAPKAPEVPLNRALEIPNQSQADKGGVGIFGVRRRGWERETNTPVLGLLGTRDAPSHDMPPPHTSGCVGAPYLHGPSAAARRDTLNPKP